VHLVEVKQLEEWGDSKQPAMYTRRVFYLSSKIPSFAARVLGRLDHLTLHEEAWNQYPYLFTQYTCPLFPDHLLFQVTTRHVDNDTGRQVGNLVRQFVRVYVSVSVCVCVCVYVCVCVCVCVCLSVSLSLPLSLELLNSVELS
jgi:Phosphatidylinositol transfer protein